MPKSTGDHWMGAPQAAEYLGIRLATLYRLIDRGEVRAYKVGRVIRLRTADVEGFLAAHQIRPGELYHLYPPGKVDAARRRRRPGGGADARQD